MGIGAILLEIAFCHNHNVLGETEAPYTAVDFLGVLSPMGAIGHDYQHLEVTTFTHLTPDRGAEKDNAQRVNSLDNAFDQIVDDLRVRVHGQPRRRYRGSGLP